MLKLDIFVKMLHKGYIYSAVRWTPSKVFMTFLMHAVKEVHFFLLIIISGFLTILFHIMCGCCCIRCCSLHWQEMRRPVVLIVLILVMGWFLFNFYLMLTLFRTLVIILFKKIGINLHVKYIKHSMSIFSPYGLILHNMHKVGLCYK